MKVSWEGVSLNLLDSGTEIVRLTKYLKLIYLEVMLKLYCGWVEVLTINNGIISLHGFCTH